MSTKRKSGVHIPIRQERVNSKAQCPSFVQQKQVPDKDKKASSRYGIR